MVLVLGTGTAALVGGLGAANGGYFPTSWGVPAIVAAAAVIVGLLGGWTALAGSGRAWVVLLGVFAGWTALALLWTDSVPSTMLELERTLLYVVAAAVFVLFGGRCPAVAVAVGVVGASSVVCAWNLAVRIGGAGSGRGEIARPLGYENGLAALAAIAVLLALGLALLAGTRRLRLASLAPLAVLAPTLVMTASTGALLALSAGGVVAVSLLCRSRVVWAGAALAIVVAVLLAATVGSSGNPRRGYWSAAWAEYTANPLLGSGPGTFAQGWLRHRSTARTTADAHGLYIEVLAESGPVGLVLLAAALLAPLAALRGARGDPLAAAAGGAYATFAVHAGVDFDWELPAVTGAGLAAGAVIVLRARGPATTPPGNAVRAAGVAAAVAVAGFSIVTLVGNRAVTESGKALATGDDARAVAQARRASAWLPWDSRPWERLGLAQLARGDPTAAAVSFRKALANDPNEAALWFDLASATTGEEARRALAQAHRLDPLSTGG